MDPDGDSPNDFFYNKYPFHLVYSETPGGLIHEVQDHTADPHFLVVTIKGFTYLLAGRFFVLVILI